MRRLIIPLLSVTLLYHLPMAALGQDVQPAPAQNTATATAPAGAGDMVPVLQYPNNPVGEILSLYERLTDKVLIRDATLSSGPALSVISPKPISRAEAIHLIEASLILNGYSLIPDTENRVKVVYTATNAKNPRSEGVPLYDNASAIPAGNQVVSYFMQLRFMASSDALSIFKEHVVLHSYGQMIEVPNAQALVITENAPLIRELIDLQELVDVPPARVVSEFVTLRRADAERVAETISKLIDAEKSEKQKHAAANPQANVPPAGGLAGAPGALYENDIVSGAVQLIPDARTNRILVITRPANFPYIKNLIGQFDEEIGSNVPLERPLKYATAREILPVLADLLQEDTSSTTRVSGGQPPVSPSAQSASQPYQNNSANNQNSNGTGGPTEPGDILHEEDDTGPTSMIVGKTHLIADNKANSILVIGPPESQQKVSEILDKLDKRPPQVYLSTVIGQLQLLNNNETGVDYAKLFQSINSTSGNQNGFAGSALNTATSLVTPQNLTAVGAFPATGGLSLYGTIGKNVSVYLHALESTNRFKVLARPVVFTANNKRAVILSGQRVPYPAGTISDVVNSGVNSTALQSNIAYQDVVLKLEVIPLINANNEVNLKIAQVDDTLAGTVTISNSPVPSISTQKIVTTVTVKNGETVVLGGLITETTHNDLTGIPILMHLPWIGGAFRDTKKSKERDELIIFIQPNVVESNEEIVSASEGEKNHAVIGPAAYDFSQPAVLPQAEMDSFFPKDSKGRNK